MKKIIFLFLVTLPVISRAQLFFNLGAGVATRTEYSTSLNEEQSPVANTSKSVLPKMQISAGYQYKKIIAEAEMLPTITRETNASNYFGAKAGIDICGLVPAVGYYFNLRNSDNAENNSSAFGYSLRYQLAINERGGVFAEAMLIENSYQLTAGCNIQIQFKK